MSDYVIFSIDEVDDPHKLAKFLRHMDSYRAMGDLSGKLILCHGSWKGKIETSFLLNRHDFEDFVRPYHFTEAQEALLWVSADKSQVCTMEYKDGTQEFCGRLSEVSPQDAYASDGWTYRPDLNKYWTIK